MNPKTLIAKIAAIMVPITGALVLAFLVVPSTQAQCGGYRNPAMHPASFSIRSGQAHVKMAAMLAGAGQEISTDNDEPIVGMWHFHFISDGISSGIPGGVPKGAPVDAGFAVWHNDGTEITNSGGRAPNTSALCMGVFRKIGPRTFRLNHYGISWDPTGGKLDTAGNPVGALIGPAHIQLLVTVSADGQSYWGTFTIDQYNETGTRLAHLEGGVTATRVNINTPPSPIF